MRSYIFAGLAAAILASSFAPAASALTVARPPGVYASSNSVMQVYMTRKQMMMMRHRRMMMRHKRMMMRHKDHMM